MIKRRVGSSSRKHTSQFNVTTPLNTFLWLTMGAFIVVVWTMNLLLAILLLFERIPNRPFAWSLRLGLLVSLVGMGSGFLMARPTHEQLVTMAENHGPRIVGAHSVGVADGGPWLPVVGWSAAGGDLRVAHFLGIHAMQILPFVGWFVARRRNAFARFKEAHRLALISTLGFAYLALVLLLVWQALRGQSLIHPDVQTLAAAVALLALTGLSTWVIAAHAKRIDADSSGFDSRTVSSNAKHVLERLITRSCSYQDKLWIESQQNSVAFQKRKERT